MSPQEFKATQVKLPGLAGVYRYYDKRGKLLYVGKAKNLRKRVSSYFSSKRNESNRIRLLVRKIFRIEFTIVHSEQEALLLENSLIKEHQPRYNIQLKDDKSYPFIVIKKEHFHRIFITRRLIRDGSEYFGPYTSVVRTRALLEFVRSLYPIRTCSLNLSPQNIESGKFKICLEYHLGNCLGPCENHQSESAYDESIAQIRQILRGNFAPVKKSLKLRMKQAASDLEFEDAELFRSRIALLRDFQERSTVVSSRIENVDVFAIADAGKFAYVSYLRVQNGMVVQTHIAELTRKLDESKEELLQFAVRELKIRYASDALEIILPFAVDYIDPAVGITVPQRGEKSKLLDLAHQNALYRKTEKLNRSSEKQERSSVVEVLKSMRDDFRLTEMPRHIECFDNSNLQGSNPVASMVVFKNAKPANSEYRHFHIKTVVGADDFASMKEVVFRRYRRLRDESLSFPQLIVIDGGKGQLNAAHEALCELGLEKQMALISIAKKLEEIYYPNDPLPLHINKRSPSLKVIQHIRNEAHRFAITFHRQLRSKETTDSELDGIPGIGEKSKAELLGKFKSVKKVREASLRELIAVIGKRRARVLKDYFDGNINSE